MIGRSLLLLLAGALGACGGEDGTSGGSAGTDHSRSESEAPEPVRPEDLGFELEPATLDLGMLDRSTVVHTEFAIVNTGRRELRINQIKVSCGCMKTRHPRGMVAPGESCVVLLDIGTGRGEETKALSAQVEVWQGRILRKVLGVNYLPRSALRITPAMLSFGRTAMGEGEICGELVGTADVPLDAEITPLQISTLEGSAAPLRVEFGELSREPRGSLQRLHLPIRVSLARDELVASFRMRVELTGDWIDPSGFVVSGEVHQGWYLDRSKLHLGAVRVGRSRKYDLRLMYTVDPPPRIDRVESDRETFTATWRADEQSRSLVVELCFTPESEGEDRARVEVWVEGSAQPLLLEVAGRAQ